MCGKRCGYLKRALPNLCGTIRKSRCRKSPHQMATNLGTHLKCLQRSSEDSCASFDAKKNELVFPLVESLGTCTLVNESAAVQLEIRHYYLAVLSFIKLLVHVLWLAAAAKLAFYLLQWRLELVANTPHLSSITRSLGLGFLTFSELGLTPKLLAHKHTQSKQPLERSQLNTSKQQHQHGAADPIIYPCSYKLTTTTITTLLLAPLLLMEGCCS